MIGVANQLGAFFSLAQRPFQASKLGGGLNLAGGEILPTQVDI